MIRIRRSVVNHYSPWNSKNSKQAICDWFIYVNKVQGWQKYRKTRLFETPEVVFAQKIFEFFFTKNTANEHNDNLNNREKGVIYEVKIH